MLGIQSKSRLWFQNTRNGKKYFTTDYNKFTNNTLDAKITKKLANESGLNEKIKALAPKQN